MIDISLYTFQPLILIFVGHSLLCFYVYSKRGLPFFLFIFFFYQNRKVEGLVIGGATEQVISLCWKLTSVVVEDVNDMSVSVARASHSKVYPIIC